VLRKWADKRINFQTSYKCRANLAVLSGFLDNWQQLVLEEIGITPTEYMLEFFRVMDERKRKNMVRKATTEYITARYKSKAKKYQQKESREFTYGMKKELVKKSGGKNSRLDGKKRVKKEAKSKPKSCVCYGCGKIVSEYDHSLHSHIFSPWIDVHQSVCQPLTLQEAHKMKLPNCYVLIEDLKVPELDHFQPIGENIEQTLEKLSLDDVEEEDNDKQAEMSADEESEPEIELVRQVDDAKKDKGVRKTLTNMQKTKII
jgi:hypothetical protein